MKRTSLDSSGSWDSIYINFFIPVIEDVNHEGKHFEDDRKIKLAH